MIHFAACTLNYLPRAVVLARSLAEHEPGTRLTVVLADRIAGRFDPSRFPEIDVVECESLGIPGLDDMMRRYTPRQFSLALKVVCQTFLLERDPAADAIVLLDADLCIYAPIEAHIRQALGDGSILQSPHMLHPVGDEQASLEVALLRHGIFNAGFCAVRRSAEGIQFLDWWSHRAGNRCMHDPKRGIHYEQSWLSLVPSIFPGCRVWRHPGANVAWWNIHERHVARGSDDAWTVNGEPLLVYHFSSLPADPAGDSIALALPHLRFADFPGLSALHSDYRSRIARTGIENLGSAPCLLPLRRSEPARSKNAATRILRRLARAVD